MKKKRFVGFGIVTVVLIASAIYLLDAQGVQPIVGTPALTFAMLAGGCIAQVVHEID